MLFSERIFRLTFFISLGVHVVILAQNPNLNPFTHRNKDLVIEVTYIKPQSNGNLHLEPSLLKKEGAIKPQSKVDLKKMAPPPFLNKEDILKIASVMRPNEPSLTKPTVLRSGIVITKKKITLPAVDIGADKISNPTYISYYEVVREKIRRAAYFNYRHEEIGEVYLSFMVASDGSLKEIQLVEDRSSANDFLREIALRSVKDSAPFPVFPPGLDHPQLSFNVVISFEIE